MPTAHPMFIFVGGFLGAGKTTLILKAAAILRERGRRVALIMNDQDAELVDTRQARAHDFRTGEVAGGCFCCRFSDLMDTADAFADYAPEYIFAEPVGSCVDLSATILQPLRALHAGAYRLAPLSVLVDPSSLEQRRRGEMDGDVEFLFSNQMAEADLLCVTKQDLYPVMPWMPFPVDFRMSGRTGAGVEEWLQEVLHTNRTVGARILDVDYARYAAAEAALGWVNLHAELALDEPLAPSLVVGPLLDQICDELRAAKIEIAHLKVFDQAASGWVKAAVTARQCDPQPEGDLLADPAHSHALAVNLRALADPALLDKIVRRALATLGGRLHIGHAGAFRPAPPVPQHRFSARAVAVDRPTV